MGDSDSYVLSEIDVISGRDVTLWILEDIVTCGSEICGAEQKLSDATSESCYLIQMNTNSTSKCI